MTTEKGPDVGGKTYLIEAIQREEYQILVSDSYSE